MNSKLAAIAEIAAADLKRYIFEAEDEILTAQDSCVDEAQANETTPIFTLSFTIKNNLAKKEVETKLGFGMKHTLSRKFKTPDPDQLKLPATEEPTVRIKTGDHDTGEVPLSAMKKAVEKLKGN